MYSKRDASEVRRNSSRDHYLAKLERQEIVREIPTYKPKELIVWAYHSQSLNIYPSVRDV